VFAGARWEKQLVDQKWSTHEFLFASLLISEKELLKMNWPNPEPAIPDKIAKTEWIMTSQCVSLYMLKKNQE
jgi:hypothetical protein